MKYYLVSFLFILSLHLFAQSDDDNMIIKNQTCTYTYKQESDNVIVEEKQEIVYSCLKNVQPITFYRFYDLYSEITNIKAKGVNASSPQYETYTRQGIFYADEKVCYLNLDFKKKDEIATVTYQKKYKDVYKFSCINIVENHFVKNKAIQIIVPQWMQIDIVENNFDSRIIKSKNVDAKSGNTIYSFQIENQEGWKYEDNMPDYMTVFPTIQIIARKATKKEKIIEYFASFEHMYQWCNRQANLTDNDRVAVGELAEKITEGSKTDLDKINALLNWVQNNIRYVAFEYGSQGFKPDEAQAVIRKKYGDCKGMSNLLKCLLIAEGFDARLVWINTTELGREWILPIPSADHMICALKYNNEYHFLDPTVKFMPFGEIAYSIQGKMAMVADGNKYLMIRTPSFPPSHNREQLVTNYAIDEGRLIGQSQLSFNGESKYAMAHAIQYTNKTNVNMYLKSYLQCNNPTDSIVAMDIEGITADAKSLLIKYKEIRPSGIQSFNDELYLNLDVFKDFASLNIDTLKRKNDYVFPFNQNHLRNIKLIIPKGYNVTDLPPNLTVKTDRYEFSISYALNKDTIVYQKEITLKDPNLPKSKFGEWNANLEKLKSAYSKQITLKRN